MALPRDTVQFSEGEQCLRALAGNTVRLFSETVDRARFNALVEHHSADGIVAALRPYVTAPRQGRIEDVLHKRMGGVRVAIEAPCDPHNAAAIVRTAEALGLLDVHVIAAEGEALHGKRTTQGAFHWVRTHHHADLAEFTAELGDGVALAGAWMDAPVELSEVPCDRPLCILLGNENRGLSAEAKAACDLGFRIPMYGMSESLNLSVSAALALYDVLTRRRAAVGATDLDDDARAQLRAYYYVECVDPRLIVGVLGAA